MPYRPAQQTLDAWEFAVKTVPGVDMRLADMPPGGAVLAETMFGRLVRPGTTVRDETVDAPPWVETVHETYGALPAFARSRAMLRGMSLQTGAGVYGRHVLPALAELASAITAAKDDVDEDADQEDAPASAPTTMEEALANLRAATRSVAAGPDLRPTKGEVVAAAAAKVGAAMQRAGDDVLRYKTCLFGAGCDAGAASEDSAATMMVADAIQNSAEMRTVLEMAGRLRLVARAIVKAKPREGTGTVVGITCGDSIPHLLPSALVNFRRQRALFRLQYVNKTLLQYKMSHPEAEIRGPVVMLLDMSGSMADAGRALWAKAVAIASAEIADAEGRPLYVIPFNGRSLGVINVAERRIEASLEIARLAPTGGTRFTPPMLQAVALLEDHADADFILVTDGESNDDDVVAAAGVLAAAREKIPDLTVMGFLFGEASPLTMSALCGHMTMVEEIANEAEAALGLVGKAVL